MASLSTPSLPSLLLCVPACQLLLVDASMQGSLYTEQGILCCIVAVQIVEILGGKIKGTYHTVIPLMSLSLFFFFLVWNLVKLVLLERLLKYLM